MSKNAQVLPKVGQYIFLSCVLNQLDFDIGGCVVDIESQADGSVFIHYERKVNEDVVKLTARPDDVKMIVDRVEQFDLIEALYHQTISFLRDSIGMIRGQFFDDIKDVQEAELMFIFEVEEDGFYVAKSEADLHAHLVEVIGQESLDEYIKDERIQSVSIDSAKKVNMKWFCELTGTQKDCSLYDMMASHVADYGDQAGIIASFVD